MRATQVTFSPLHQKNSHRPLHAGDPISFFSLLPNWVARTLTGRAMTIALKEKTEPSWVARIRGP
jgi:hypothetical protein